MARERESDTIGAPMTTEKFYETLKFMLDADRELSLQTGLEAIGVPGKFCTSGSETNWYGRSMEWPRPGSTRLSRL